MYDYTILTDLIYKQHNSNKCILSYLLFMFSLGFSNISTIEDVIEAYPLLDVADHDRRFKVVNNSQFCMENKLLVKL